MKWILLNVYSLEIIDCYTLHKYIYVFKCFVYVYTYTQTESQYLVSVSFGILTWHFLTTQKNQKYQKKKKINVVLYVGFGVDLNV